MAKTESYINMKTFVLFTFIPFFTSIDKTKSVGQILLK